MGILTSRNMEFDREKARSYFRIQRVVIISTMVLAGLLMVACLLNGGSIFNGPASFQMSAVLFISLIAIMLIASVPSLFIKRSLKDDQERIEEPVLNWDEDEEEEEIYEVISNPDGVRSGKLL